MNDIFDRAVTAVRNNPEALLLFGAGLALALRKTAGFGKPARPQKSGSKKKKAPEPSIVPDSVRDFVSDTQDRVVEYSDAVSKKTRRAYRAAENSTRDFAEANPAAIALAGLAAGLLVGAVLPATDIERSALGPIAQKASDLADQAKDSVKDAAVAAGTQALRAGLGAAMSTQDQTDVR